jgi:hypothetical protein
VALFEQHHTHDPALRLRPHPVAPHRAHRRPAHRAVRARRVTLGWLDTHPHPYPERRLVMTGLDLDYPATIAAELGVEEVHVLTSRTGPPPPHAAVEGSHWLDALLQPSPRGRAMGQPSPPEKTPKGGPEYRNPGQGQSRLTNYTETPYASLSLGCVLSGGCC